MNFDSFSFDNATQNAISTLVTGGNIPHAIIIECEDDEKSLQISKLLSMFALCDSNSENNKPCGACKSCKNAFTGHHADLSFAYPEKKTQIYSIEQIRDIIKDAYIMPNGGKAKVYVFEKADERLLPVAQNAFLKLLEEPPKLVHFIMLCKNANSMLTTILSRCTVVRISSRVEYSEKAIVSATEIVEGIISSKEYNLLKSLLILNDKDISNEALLVVKLLLRDGLAVICGGKAELNEELADRLSARLTKNRLIRLIEITDTAIQKLSQNSNTNLLATWLCSEYRRISWQR